MAEYIDKTWRQPARLGPVDDRWSHLVADDDAELHDFAARLGMRREWFQHKASRPHQAHYDIPHARVSRRWTSGRFRSPGARSAG